MIFILTGPDGSGKTMLAQQMAKHSGGEIVHFSYPRTKAEKLMQFSMYQELLQSCKTKMCFLEHAWYSEMAYGPIKRNKSYIEWHQMYMLERETVDICGGGLIIYCTGQALKMYARAQERGEKYITSQDDYLGICSNFDMIMRAPHHIPVVRYEYNDM